MRLGLTSFGRAIVYRSVMSTSAGSSSKHPMHWHQPCASNSTERPSLKVYNSLTRSKVPFITREPNLVTWYNCGPTVYDDSHMGHARNYVTQDYLRRILQDYFGYNVQFVMNITDIDDKIILRARQAFLFEQFKKQHPQVDSELLQTLQSAWQTYFDASIACDIENLIPSGSTELSQAQWQSILDGIKAFTPEKVEQLKKDSPKFNMHLTALTKARAELDQASVGSDSSKLLTASEGILAEHLDKTLGSSVNDPAVFRLLPAQMEESFFKDMADLRVQPPTTLTRVTEYVPEIVRFVERIVANGYAYAVEGGSVYFDVARFDGAKKQAGLEGNASEDWTHTYAKLQPWSKGDTKLQEEGEGALNSGAGKRSKADFALWKGSKEGEPAWDSPWGKGRPGWHIECSVMASAILGEGMDIHSGGIDLAFPHHDNEMAQSEAYHDCQQWVNYFLHTGHLHIEGLKMSKSLKNFITIKEALQSASARQLRLAFLLTAWSSKMDFKESSMVEVRSKEALFNNFFTNIKAIVNKAQSEGRQLDGQHHHDEAESHLLARLQEAQIETHAALCDSFDTARALQTMVDLINTANTYISTKQGQIVNTTPLEAVGAWVTRILRIFGLGEGPGFSYGGRPEIGWGEKASDESAGVDREAAAMPFVRTLSRFRDQVRKLGRTNPELMALCDKLRDEDLVQLGVALDDQPDGTALVKMVPKEQLLKAREEKAAQAAAKAAKAEERKQQADEQARQKAAKEAEELELGKIPPSQWFKRQTDKFSAWDEAGFPTTTKEGEPLAKSAHKKLQKELAVQTKRHDKYLATLSNGSA